MSRARLTRVQRVLDVRQNAADRLAVELSELSRAVLAAEAVARLAGEDWLRAMSTAPSSPCSITDLAEMHGYAVVVGHRYEARVREHRDAEKRRDACLVRLAGARVEVRKLEIWGDRIRDAAAREEASRERREMDELAARTRTTRTA